MQLMSKDNMRNLFKFIIVLILLISLTGCPEEFPELDTAIEIINNSEEDIIWFKSSDFTTSDTSKLIENFPWREIKDYRIEKGTAHLHEFNLILTKENLDEGYFQYFLLSYDTVQLVPWSRIRSENIILKKVYFETWEDMEACNFTITYP